MKNKSKMTTVAVIALLYGTEKSQAIKLNSELIIDAEN
jgi:hypothetical protein